MVIVTYSCYVASTTPPMISNEHKRAALFTHDEVLDLNMPDGSKRSITTDLSAAGHSWQSGHHTVLVRGQ